MASPLFHVRGGSPPNPNNAIAPASPTPQGFVDAAQAVFAIGQPVFWVLPTGNSIVGANALGTVYYHFDTFGNSHDLGGNQWSEIRYPHMTSLTGNLDFGTNNGNPTLDFGVLTSLSGRISFNASTISNFSLPALTAITNPSGILDFGNCASLTTFGIDALQVLGGQIQLTNCISLTFIQLPSLTTFQGTLNLSGCNFDTTSMDSLCASLAATVTTGGGTLDLTVQLSGNQPSDGGPVEALRALGVTVNV